MGYRHNPFTGDADDYELQIAAANGVPTDIDSANVEYATLTGTEVAKARRGPKVVQINGVFTGSDKDNAVWLLRYWCWLPAVSRWYFSPDFTLVGINGHSETLGQMARVANDPNASHGYIEVVSGVAANQVLEVTVTAAEW